MHADCDAYPPGCVYKLHYGATEPDPPQALADGTIRRYDNFPGMVDLWERFWSKVPKSEFEVN